MKNRDHVSSIIEPTESEGVFTIAQAARNARWVIWRGKGQLYFKSLPLYLLSRKIQPLCKLAGLFHGEVAGNNLGNVLGCLLKCLVE